MIRDMVKEDKAAFMEMADIFYSSAAVTHKVERNIYEATFDAAVGGTPYLRALIVEDEGAAVGFALLSFSFATEMGGLAVLLEDLYISETCRGKGLGSEFMRFMEREYASAKRFRLEVTKENAKAIELYRRLGYSVLEYVQMVKEQV